MWVMKASSRGPYLSVSDLEGEWRRRSRSARRRAVRLRAGVWRVERRVRVRGDRWGGGEVRRVV